MKNEKSQVLLEFWMTYGWAILVAIIVVGILVAYYFLEQRPQEINPENITVNKTKLNELRYKITIDCKWVAENSNDYFIFNGTNILDVCKDIFPELYENVEKEK